MSCAKHVSVSQFMAKTGVDEAPCLMLLDFTKSGRLTSKDLDRDINMVKKFLASKPLATMAVVLAPFLESAKASGLRGEMKRRGFNYYMACTHGVFVDSI